MSHNYIVSHINFKLSFVLSCCDCLYKIKTLKLFETITYQIYIICTSFVIYFTSVISQHSRAIQFLKWSKTCLHKAFPITTTKANAYCCIRWKQLSTFIVLRDIDLDFTTVLTFFYFCTTNPLSYGSFCLKSTKPSARPCPICKIVKINCKKY